MINVVICDDNKSNAKYLDTLIAENVPDVGSIKSFSKEDSLLSYVFDKAHGDIDVICMDIDLGESNGISVAQQILREYPSIKIVFVTAHIDYAEDVFSVNPIHFLVKPVRVEKLVQAFDKIRSTIEKEKAIMLPVESKGTIINLNTSDIVYLFSDKRKLHIVMTDRDVEIYAKLDDIAVKLPENFIRCHKSYMVNTHVIESLCSDTFQLKNGESIPISRSMIHSVKSKFLSYIGDFDD